MNSYNVIVLFSSLVVATCQEPKKNCCNISDDSYRDSPYEKTNTLRPDSLIFNTGYFRRIVENASLSPGMGLHIIERQQKFYLCALDGSEDSLLAINIFDSTDFHAIALYNVVPKREYLTKISETDLYLVDVGNFICFHLYLDSNFSISIKQEISLNDIYSFKGKFINSNFEVDDFLECINNNLIVPYGKFDKVIGMGKTPWLCFDLQKKQVRNIFDYPSEFECPTFRTINMSLRKDSDSTVVTVFSKINRLYRINIETNKIIAESSEFNFNSQFMCFDRQYEPILSYSQKYDLNDEDNSRLIVSKDGYYLVKRLKKLRKDDWMKCAILKFDRNLKHLGTYFPDITVAPRYSFGWKNGVVIFNQLLDKAYYYDFSKQ